MENEITKNSLKEETASNKERVSINWPILGWCALGILVIGSLTFQGINTFSLYNEVRLLRKDISRGSSKEQVLSSI